MLNEDKVGVGVTLHSNRILNIDITLTLYTVSVGKKMYVIVNVNKRKMDHWSNGFLQVPVREHCWVKKKSGNHQTLHHHHHCLVPR